MIGRGRQSTKTTVLTGLGWGREGSYKDWRGEVISLPTGPPQSVTALLKEQLPTADQ